MVVQKHINNEFYCPLHYFYTGDKEYTMEKANTQARKEHDRIIPRSFPGTVGLSNNTEKRTLLHPMYRRYKDADTNDEGFQEFLYFLGLLAKVNAQRTKFKTLKSNKLISEIFTPSDEAFGLLVIENEHDGWEEQYRKKKQGLKGKDLFIKKKFCDGRSGNKDGWTSTGLLLYRQLVEEVTIRRRQTKDFEEKLRTYFRGEEGNNRNPSPMGLHAEEESEEIKGPYAWLHLVNKKDDCEKEP